MNDTTQSPKPSFRIERISSIGWLNGINRTIILTPCIDGSSYPTKLTITREEFEAIRGDDNLIKQKVCEILSGETSTEERNVIYFRKKVDEAKARLDAIKDPHSAEWIEAHKLHEEFLSDLGEAEYEAGEAGIKI